MSSFHPQNPQDWHTFLDREVPPRPGPTDHLDAATLERFVGYTLQLGPIPTDDTVAVHTAVTAAQLRNRHAPLHGQHVVVIDGGPMAGKTYAALRCALTQTRAARTTPPPDPACLHPAPWAYVEVTQHHGIASLAQSLAGAIGAIVESRDRTPQILAKIRALAPRVGLAGYIVDDSHGILGARSRDSTTLATTLKGLITGIPATAVIVGADLRAQGILSGSAGEQVRLRSAGTWVTCGQWPTPDGTTVTGWEKLVATMHDALSLPGGPAQYALARRPALLTLAEGSLGRPGIAIDWIKDAAIHAMTNETTVDLNSLHATAPDLNHTTS